MICVDCDHAIVGDYVTTVDGASMSGARPDAYAHLPGDPECQPRDRSKAALRRALYAATVPKSKPRQHRS
ncbi:hypothetical protein ACF07T_32630 [Streptomyces sp. NPDC015184]|uniref:hypothetical protein n=1 Tax=Streptomyces sp. NPDC015184 TaxID=3364946 RepID=UPI00370329F3